MKYTARLRAQRGVTLVELMVAMAVGLIISLAAAVLYLATQDTARATRSFSDTNETGKLALDLIGRELEKAGFYPAEFEAATTAATVSEKQVGQYANIKNPGAANSIAFDQGLFGCRGAAFDPSSRVCPTPVDGAPDSIVINYFTSREFGANAVIGNTNDCNRQPITADTDNTARATAGLPLMVSNRFALIQQSIQQPDGSTIVTHVLGCHGNGKESDTAYQPLLQGVEDLMLTYGVFPVGATQSAAQFYTATDVAGVAWQRISSVRVCIVVRSLENARLEDKSGSERVKPNCRGATTKLASNDRYIYKRFDQVFAVRNYLTGLQ